MKERFNCIIEYLNNRVKEAYTGSVKLSFERGECVLLHEANQHDLPVTASDSETQDIIKKYLEMAKDPIFNGAIVFVFENGEIKSFSYSKTYKGETLKKYLGA